ncbi:uncharacterized protein LOC126283952 [Schistocerca gregaria]|uniref:uncharacterized protein LOC126283952 n=1 Tax=Schistocerca gregaria TaxID=7010 RepID=UPI00211E4269|nr:uncharacterized protein LOC126283952 [Schistocerca gregaria]
MMYQEAFCDALKFRRNELVTSSRRTTRRKLQDKYDREQSCPSELKVQGKRKREKLWTGLNLSNIQVTREDATRMLRSGANKISKTLSSMQTTFGVISQKFRRSTRRRHRLKSDSPRSPLSPQTRSRCLLGRTPTKLYSPFGIETPCLSEKENGRHIKAVKSNVKACCNSAVIHLPAGALCRSKRCRYSTVENMCCHGSCKMEYHENISAAAQHRMRY